MRQYRFHLLLALACVIAGAAVGRDPVTGLIAAGLLLFAGSLELGAAFLVGMTVFAACGSRLIQSAGVPRLVNFLHFALAVEAVVAAYLLRRPAPLFVVRLERLLVVSFALCCLSWALNGGELLRPVLMWLVVYEPFLIIIALSRYHPGPGERRSLDYLLAAIVLAQLPFAVYQYRLGQGDPDTIQGTFIGSGVGAHVAGGIALTGVLFCFSKALASRGTARFAAITGAPVLLVFPVVADAKQVIVCFLPGLFLVILLSRPESVTRLLTPMAAAGGAFTVAWMTYRPLQRIANPDMLRLGIQGKIEAFEALAKYMNRHMWGWFLGVGPGNSVSRIGVLAHESPLQAVGLKVSPITSDLLDVTKHNYLWNSSSVWTPISSWMGILGDLGFLGLITYACACAIVWREIRRSHTWQGYAAAGTMLSAGLLGLFYSWLEEPGFMLPIAVAAGLAMVGRRAARTTPVSIVSAYSPLGTPNGERPVFAPAISVHPAGRDDR